MAIFLLKLVFQRYFYVLTWFTDMPLLAATGYFHVVSPPLPLASCFQVAAVIKLLWNLHTDWFSACAPHHVGLFAWHAFPKVERRLCSSCCMLTSCPVEWSRLGRIVFWEKGQFGPQILTLPFATTFLWPGEISSVKWVNSLSFRIVLRPKCDNVFKTFSSVLGRIAII